MDAIESLVGGEYREFFVFIKGIKLYPSDDEIVTPPVVLGDNLSFNLIVKPGDGTSANPLYIRVNYLGNLQLEVGVKIFTVLEYDYRSKYLEAKMKKEVYFLSPLNTATENVSSWDNIASGKNVFISIPQSADTISFKVELDFNDRIVYSAPSIGTLKQDTAALLQTDTFDAFIISGSERIPVHKFMLMMRSSVFRAMLSSGLSETNSNEISISDFEPEVVKAFIHFLYTDECEVDVAFSMQLFKFAHKYEIQGLLTQCESILAKQITANNIVEYLTLADTYEAANLKDLCVTFISKNSFEVFNCNSTTEMCKAIVQCESNKKPKFSHTNENGAEKEEVMTAVEVKDGKPAECVIMYLL